MKSKRDVTQSPYTPVSKGDILRTVRLYQRTAEDDKQAIAVCVFERRQSDLSRVVAGTNAVMQYCKIGPAGFSVHNDTDGVLLLHVDSYAGAGHFRALLKLGIRHVSVTGFSSEHGSELSKRAGVAIQNLTFEAGGFNLPYHRSSLMTDWFVTLGAGSFATDPKIFETRSEYRWGDMDVIWCGGLAWDALKSEQAEARRIVAAREQERQRRRDGANDLS